jgi:hypothetical protein
MSYRLSCKPEEKGGSKMKKSYQYKSHRTARIGRLEAWFMRNKGLHDGRLGLPRKDETGKWTSPQVQRELDAYSEFTECEWLLCEEATAELHIATERLFQEIKRMQSQFQNFPDDLRYLGEENLDDWVVQQRRRKKLSCLEQAENRFNEQIQQIAEIENQSRLKCERVKCHIAGRIAVYWIGCMESNPHAENLPPAPPAMHAFGEDTYMSQHRSSLRRSTMSDGQQTGEEDHYA